MVLYMYKQKTETFNASQIYLRMESSEIRPENAKMWASVWFVSLSTLFCSMLVGRDAIKIQSWKPLSLPLPRLPGENPGIDLDAPRTVPHPEGWTWKILYFGPRCAAERPCWILLVSSLLLSWFLISHPTLSLLWAPLRRFRPTKSRMRVPFVLNNGKKTHEST